MASQSNSMSSFSRFLIIHIFAIYLLLILSPTQVHGESTSAPFTIQIALETKACKKGEKYNITTTTSEQKPIRVREYAFCWAVPPQCSRYYSQIKTITRNETIEKTRYVDTCCKGYAETADGKNCVPVCSNPCKGGKCVEPNKCQCFPGYGGSDCSITCPSGKWGENNCENKCQCVHSVGNGCDIITGKCHCQAGWTGEFCDQPCPTDTYGNSCQEKCRCLHGGSCDPVTGECRCQPGFRGPLCQDLCPEGKHGASCSSECRCQNGGSCDSRNGTCYCTPGWRGDVCASPCEPGKWGIQCTKSCECFNGAQCNHITGQCLCSDGFVGLLCDLECDENHYGTNCTSSCSCRNGGMCNNVNGSCNCQPGWKGRFCEDTMCQKNTYGPTCECQCTCVESNTQYCHSVDGACRCKAGWSGRDCERPCPLDTWGEDCGTRCECMNRAYCDPHTGKCSCPPGYIGDNCSTPCPNGLFGNGCKSHCKCEHGICSNEDGKCVCEDGWTGIYCDKNKSHCPDGYGPKCRAKCHCKNNGDCSIDGECRCVPGWTGELCLTPCQSGTFGLNCSQTCNCGDHGVCRPSDGECRCSPGKTGPRCSQLCSEGSYGLNCFETCQCKSKEYCHPAEGCKPMLFSPDNIIRDSSGSEFVCNLQYERPSEADLIAMPDVEKSGGANAGKVAGITLAVLFLLMIIICMALYYRRRINKLKSDLQVSYAVNTYNGDNTDDGHHFDNPVYSYDNRVRGVGTSVSISSGSSAYPPTTLNINTFTNRNGKMNNNKSFPTFDDYDDNSSRGATSSAYDFPNIEAKNREADAMNPNLTGNNIYNSIEDINKDHVYDEIVHNQQMGRKIPLPDPPTSGFTPKSVSNSTLKANLLHPQSNGDEYDHLDYSRSSSENNPLYTRVSTIPKDQIKKGGKKLIPINHSSTTNNSSGSTNSSESSDEQKAIKPKQIIQNNLPSPSSSTSSNSRDLPEVDDDSESSNPDNNLNNMDIEATLGATGGSEIPSNSKGVNDKISNIF